MYWKQHRVQLNCVVSGSGPIAAPLLFVVLASPLQYHSREVRVMPVLSVLPCPSSPAGCRFSLVGLPVNSAQIKLTRSVLAAAFVWGDRNNQGTYLILWPVKCFWRVQCYLRWVDVFSYAKSFPVQKPGMWATRAVAGGSICCCLLCTGRIIPVCSRGASLFLQWLACLFWSVSGRS